MKKLNMNITNNSSKLQFHQNLDGFNLSEILGLIKLSRNNGEEFDEQRELNRDELWIVILVTVFYAVIFFAGVIGNAVTCTVISKNRAMHTATNYYLFNLAISDLLLLISGLPLEIYFNWYPTRYPFPQSFCILQGVLSETSANATVLTITSFTVERYIAICHPFRQHTMSKLSRAVKFILAIWIVAFCLAMPQAIQFGVISIGDGGLACTISNSNMAHAFVVSSCLFFVGPMTMICALYVLIGVKLRRSKFLQGAMQNGWDINRGINAQTRVIRMLVAVVVAFFICWAPFHAQRITAVYGPMHSTSKLFQQFYTVLTYISGVLYYLSTCINPLLYNIMSHKFRDAFKSTIGHHCCGGAYKLGQHNYNALSRNGGSGGSWKLTATTTLSRNSPPTPEVRHENNEFCTSLMAKQNNNNNLTNNVSRFQRCTSAESQGSQSTEIAF